MKHGTLRLAGMALLLCTLSACEQPAPRQRVLTGLVDATEIDVASKIPGRVNEVKVKPGDTVHKGDLLVTLESPEVSAKLDQVNAAIDASSAKLKMAQQGARKEEISAVQQQLKSAKSQVALTEKMYNRISGLLEKNAVPQSQFDEIEFKYKVAQDQLAQVQAKYAIIRQGARSEEVEALEALVRQAQGALEEVQAAEREANQVAPLDAEVADVILHAGEIAAAGYPIVTLVDLTDIWVTFPIREDLLPKFSKGSKHMIELPALDKTIEVTVDHLAVMGDFATWKATNEKNSYDLKSFEVRMRPSSLVEGLRPGMTARLKVE